MPGSVVIIGGGIMGCATAYYLKKLGATFKIIIMEQGTVACHSSGKAGGFLAENWCDGGRVGPLARASFALHKEVWEESCAGSEGDHPLGYRALGASDEDGGKLGTPEHCAQVTPKLLTEYLCRQSGAEVRENTRVSRILYEAGGKKVKGIETESGEAVPCDAAVCCMGPWTCNLGKWLSDEAKATYLVPPRTFDERHTSVVLENVVMDPVAIFTSPRSAKCTSVELYPRPGNRVYICGEDIEARETGASHSIPENPADIVPTRSSIEAITELAAKYLPGPQGPPPAVTHPSSCYLPICGPNAPVIGPFAVVPNLYIAAGHSCWGILNSLGTGKILAQLVATGKTSVVPDHTAYLPDSTLRRPQ